MRQLALVLCMVFVAPIIAQDYTRNAKRFRDKFTFQLEHGETVIRTWLHYVVTARPDRTWVVRVFYPETGRLTRMITFADEGCTTRKGPTSYWYDDGTLVHAGSVDRYGRTGVWVEGSDSGAYLNDRRHGTWRFGKEGVSKHLVRGSYTNGSREGIWTTWDSLGRKTLQRSFVKDQLDGEWLEMDPLTGSTTRRVYRADSLIEGHVNHVTHQERLPCLRTCASLPDHQQRARCTEASIQEHLGRHLVYPKEARGHSLDGTALFSFVVDKDGSVIEVRTLSGLCKEIESTCLQALARMPAWEPGMQNGHAVKVSYNQPVKFTLR